jgi:arsenite-transporting ATPase
MPARRKTAGPELTLFMGKGGVGKTTVSAAYAAWLAKKNPKANILLISTDPAHSLGDVLDRRVGAKPVQVAARWQACEVDAEARFGEFLAQYRKPLMAILEAGTMFDRSEIEPLLQTTLPGMAEIAGLLAIDDALSSGKYDHVIVDTAPFGHTLRLLQMPEAFARLLRFLEVAAGRDAVLAAHFGGHVEARAPALLGEWRELMEQIVETLRSRARLVLVTSPEPFALNESARVAHQMAPLRFAEVVLNRVVSKHGSCGRCGTRAKEAARALEFLKKSFAELPVRVGEDPGFPIMGVKTLGEFGAGVFASGHIPSPRKASAHEAADEAPLSIKRVPWPAIKKPLALTLGKGGVGKTTISAALGWRTRHSGKAAPAVVVCSTDPAPSLDDVFRMQVDDRVRSFAGDAQFRAVEVDAAAEFQSWAAEMKTKMRGALMPQAGGVHLDLTFERQLFEALLDIVPPGVDEIFGVLRLGDLLAGERATIVLDMAPTGHALELLRTPERMLLWSRLLLKTLAQHRTLPLARDLGMEIAQIAARVRELAARLRDPRARVVHVVALAEPLPDRETARLLRDLDRLGMRPAALFVNRVLFAEDVSSCAYCRSRREWQVRSLRRMMPRPSPKSGERAGQAPVYLVREREYGPSGGKELAEFTRELWKVE